MGISYDSGTETITVTGGSWDEPYTMAILDTDGTAGGYITPGGYGNREYTVGKNLVIGSGDGTSTFFDLTRSIIKMADGYTLTVYSHALRGGGLQDTWAAHNLGAAKPPVGDAECKQRTENVLIAYVEVKGYLCPSTGELVRTTGPTALTPPETANEPVKVTVLSPPIGQDPCAALCGGLSPLAQLPNVGPFRADPVPVPTAVESEAFQRVPRSIVVLVRSDETVTP